MLHLAGLHLHNQVCIFYQIKSSQHEHSVDKHEEPSRDHFKTIKEDCLGADVTKTEIKITTNYLSFAASFGSNEASQIDMVSQS